MLALFSRILKLSGRYKGRIQGAFACAFVESILSKMPIFLAFIVLSGFHQNTMTGQKCLYVGLGMFAVVVAQAVVHYCSDRLQSAAGYMMFTDKRMELGGHLRKLPMGYFTSGNIGKISSVLSTDMVFIEEVAMSTLGNMMSHMLSALVLLIFMSFLDWRLGLVAVVVTVLASLIARSMNRVSLGEAAGRQEQSERLTDAVLSFTEGASRHTVMNAALDRIEAVLNEKELPDTGTQHIPETAQQKEPEICFEDVSFAYRDKEVLHGLNFSMRKNTMTALVGPSGGGKSTIANLLARLWDVKSGKVTIRGIDIRNVPLAELMEQISMVFQRVYLFQDTVYNNISMGKPDATEEKVYEAARKARCYDFIMALPDGFQTVVGEGGATLSGGEIQRISIARCILKDAPIVILDEATASVDVDNESYIQEAISELVKGKTLLVIAHRLNTIREADQILVISDGCINEQGTHDELVEKAGIYQDFVNIRKQSSGWSIV